MSGISADIFKNIRYTDFLPHAGVELGSRHKPLAERGIDVLYAGALPIYTVAKMIPDLSSIPEVRWRGDGTGCAVRTGASS